MKTMDEFQKQLIVILKENSLFERLINDLGINIEKDKDSFDFFIKEMFRIIRYLSKETEHSVYSYKMKYLSEEVKLDQKVLSIFKTYEHILNQDQKNKIVDYFIYEDPNAKPPEEVMNIFTKSDFQYKGHMDNNHGYLKND